MVSSQDLDDLDRAFNVYKKLEAPDMFSVGGDMSDALFDIYTVDSYIAGLVAKVLDGGSLTHEEIEGIPKHLFDNDGFSLVSISNPRQPIDLKGFPEVLRYVRALDELRILLVEITVSYGKPGKSQDTR